MKITIGVLICLLFLSGLSNYFLYNSLNEEKVNVELITKDRDEILEKTKNNDVISKSTIYSLNEQLANCQKKQNEQEDICNERINLIINSKTEEVQEENKTTSSPLPNKNNQSVSRKPSGIDSTTSNKYIKDINKILKGVKNE